MLTKFIVKNYRKFEDEMILDFTKTRDYHFNTNCVENGIAQKIMLFGKNGVGKTNIGRAIQDICWTLNIGSLNVDGDSSFLNANSKSDTAFFEYHFIFDEHAVVFAYQKKDITQISNEKLIIDDKVIYFYDYEKQVLVTDNLNSVGINSSIVNRIELLTGMEDGGKSKKFSLLSWILTNSDLNMDSVLGRIFSFAMQMRVLNASFLPRGMIYSKDILESIYLNQEEKERMNLFFNTMGISGNLDVIRKTEGGYELVKCFDDNKFLPFSTIASSGEKKIWELYSHIVFRRNNFSLLFLDEFDALYHYELTLSLINFLLKYYDKSQIVFTTHNTNLLSNKILRPDCYFIVSDDKITSLCDATNLEIREGHNLEKLYISGAFSDYE